MSCVYDNRLESQHVRYFSISVFGLLYFGFTVMLGIRLNDWNDVVPGRCYRTSNIALPYAKHPYVDQVYLGVTSYYVYSLLVIVIGVCRVPRTRLYWQKSIIFVGALQFILHVYILVALRISNQPLLDNVALEDQWGFGQVIAIMMLVATLLECAKSIEGELLIVIFPCSRTYLYPTTHVYFTDSPGPEYLSWKKKEAVSLREKAQLEGRQATMIHPKTFP